MNILVIGNGFDLAHDLPTSYNDFLMFLKNFKNIYEIGIENIDRQMNASIFKTLNENVQPYLSDYKRIRNKDNKLMNELYNLSKNNVWISHFEESIKDNKLKGKNWIDFESEIADIIKSLECLKTTNKDIATQGSTKIENLDLRVKGSDFINDIKKEHNVIKFSADEFYDYNATMIIDELYIELNNLIRCLEIYLEDVVGNIEIVKTLPDIEGLEKIDRLISFNYTYTFEKLYNKNPEIKYDYIHGKLDISKDISENNMVLGIDEYLNDEYKNKDLDFIRFKKYFQRIFKKTGCQYKNWFEEVKYYQSRLSEKILTNNNGSGFANHIYIYGHSLDITDKDILKELIMFPKTQTTIFYYDNNDYAKKITNMVGLIGQDRLINNVHGVKPSIIFKPICK